MQILVHDAQCLSVAQDMAWAQQFAQTKDFNGKLAKAVIQNPLEYRAVTGAAMQFGSRPHDLDIEPEQAVEFCIKMMT
jgi:hypothetical protein